MAVLVLVHSRLGPRSKGCQAEERLTFQFHANRARIALIAKPSCTNLPVLSPQTARSRSEQHVESPRPQGTRCRLEAAVADRLRRLKAHRRNLVRACRDSTNGAVQSANLSDYSPDLNVE